MREAVVRPLMFVLWSIVFWGTFLFVAGTWLGLTEGPRAALDAFRPRAPHAFWGWVNVLSVPFALLVWSVLGFGLASRRRGSHD